MLTAMPLSQPSPKRGILAAIYERFFSRAGADMATHGTARFTVDGEHLVPDVAELSFQPGRGEPIEAFALRVCNEAADGDVVEFRVRDGVLVGATVTRRAAVPLRIDPGETLEQFAQRAKQYKDLPRA